MPPMYAAWVSQMERTKFSLKELGLSGETGHQILGDEHSARGKQRFLWCIGPQEEGFLMKFGLHPNPSPEG